MANELSGGYEPTSNYVPRSAEDSDGTRTATTRRGLTVQQRLLMGLGGAVLVSSLTACGPAEAPAPTGTETVAPSDELITAEELTNDVELSAEKYGTPEEVSQAFIDVSLKDWYNTMDPNAAFQQFSDNNFDALLTVQQINKPLDDAVVATVFIENWSANTNLTTQINGGIDNHRMVAQLNLLTSGETDSNDKEPYEGQFVANSIEISNPTETSFTATIVRQYTDNHDKNRGLTLTGDTISYDPLQPETVQFVLVNGVWKVADWTVGY